MNPIGIDIDELTEKVSMCSNLDDVILKYLNLVNINYANKINSLKEAIVYLGVRNARSILISIITKLLLPDILGRSKLFSNSQYWKHSIGTSVAGAIICEKTGIADKHRIFSLGLVHDIGVTVLDICLPELLDKIHDMQLKGIHQIVAERIVLGGLTHPDIGVWLCEKWSLPNDFVDIIGFHHAPLLAKDSLEEVKIIHLADTISTNYYERLLGVNSTYIYSKEVMNSLGITQSDIDELIVRLPNEIEKHSLLIDFQTNFSLN